MVLRALDLGPGDQVLTTDHEYGALDRTWRFLGRKRGFEYVRRPLPLPLTDREIPVIGDPHADPEKGTGILMVCTFGDAMDVEWWKHSGLPLKQLIGRDGRILGASFGETPYGSVDAELAQRHDRARADARPQQSRFDRGHGEL